MDKRNNWTEEEAREQGMVDAGRQRVEKAIALAKEKGHEHTVAPWKGMIPALIVTSMEALAKEAGKRGKNRPRGMSHLMAAKLEPELVLQLGATAVIDGICHQQRTQWVVRRIGTFIETEVKVREFAKQEPKKWKKLQQASAERHSTNISAKLAAYKRAARRAQYESTWTDWSVTEGATVGSLVLSCLIQGGVVETFKLGTYKKAEQYVRLTPAGDELLTAREDFALSTARPCYRPMVVPPMDWTPETDGGYYAEHLDVPFVKTHRAGDVERFRVADMPEVYAAVNRVQATPWVINRDVLVVAEELFKAGGGRAGLPLDKAAAKPVRPTSIPEKDETTVLTEEQTELLEQYRVAMRTYHNDEARRASQHTQADEVLKIAESCEREEAIYFPHNLDWRGRVYPVPTMLNPQGTDLAKGLLTFADARPLGEMGAFWLAVHGANSWGKDKAPLNERVDWVCDSDALIQRVAEDPLTHRDWEEADAPFQFLAFCLEWAAYLDSGESPDFESRLPVAMDGSCNGLQHFSALLRDPVGAAATNLVPCDVPSDMYTLVADKVRETVEAQAGAGDRKALAWKQAGIERGLVKQVVMTTPYGVTHHGGHQQLQDAIEKLGIARKFEDAWDAARWLTPHVFDAIHEVVLAAQEAQSFLQEVARVLAKADKAVGWTTPAGFPVIQDYDKGKSVRIKSNLFGVSRLHYKVDTNVLDKTRQKMGAAPNFVHSYDAAHLMLTVNATQEQADHQMAWCMVHDSFGTHAGDVDLMGRVLREQFVLMYKDSDPLEVLRGEALKRLPDDAELPEVPARGTFDLDEVLRAEFFFA